MSASDVYKAGGADLLRGLLSPEVAAAIAHMTALGVAHSGARWLVQPRSILDKPCYEAPSGAWPVLLTFLWGMTPKIEDIAGVHLLPTYSYFRTYQQGDVCRVHSDRPACEHSVSLTLAYADGIPWALAVADTPKTDSHREQKQRGEDGFGDEAYSEYVMAPGDAVVYRGIDYRHGRLTPNPNRWSAHLFMHWVDRDGPHRNQMFDGRNMTGPVDFRFP
ncbi:MAG TPA: hypothetical protein VK753_05335 [Xanthomonadaceae bacterium]|jgi:hypothetical protein|nr:hypothetical protein [Xanthomonadaceae bacterium]